MLPCLPRQNMPRELRITNGSVGSLSHRSAHWRNCARRPTRDWNPHNRKSVNGRNSASRTPLVIRIHWLGGSNKPSWLPYRKPESSRLCAEVQDVLQQTDSMLQQADDVRKASIDYAIGVELHLQKDAYRQNIKRLSAQLADLRCDVVVEQAVLAEFSTSIEIEQAAAEVAAQRQAQVKRPSCLMRRKGMRTSRMQGW